MDAYGNASETNRTTDERRMEAQPDLRKGLGTRLAERRGGSKRKDRGICEEIRTPSEVLSKGIGRSLRQMATAAAHVNAMWLLLRNANDFGSREVPFLSSPAGGSGAFSRRQLGEK